jgi:2-iminobutanoate/2-iminopropanoate deaminase
MPQRIEVPGHPPNNPTYSQAVRMAGLIYVSGQLGWGNGIQEQTRSALENIRRILEAAGSSLANVGKVNIYITDFTLLGEMNKVYAEFFPHRPAKTTVEVSRLDKDGLIEIEVVASER